MKLSLVKAVLPFLLLGLECSAYDLTFNTDKDVTQWAFNGSYIYSKAIANIAALLPSSLVLSSKKNDVFRVGVWLARYNGPDADNFLTFQYSLKHHLFKQGYVHFIASPKVPIIVTTTNNQEVGRFWSNGTAWCDAIFNIDLLGKVNIHMETPESGDYALVDLIVMGVMSNLQMTRKLNPCLTSAPNSTTIGEDLLAPDMLQKQHSTMTTSQVDHTPPDMMQKPSHHHHQASGASPPDMLNKSGLNTDTVTTSDTNGQQNGDPAEVNCGCSCNCSRKGKKAVSNATNTTSG